ncbi:MAG: hypothetical protein JEZ00_05935 [Anaerolineaceae bacterium]|nr:hypothetical protein [Anaerolineaceae bacterium]
MIQLFAPKRKTLQILLTVLMITGMLFPANGIVFADRQSPPDHQTNDRHDGNNNQDDNNNEQRGGNNHSDGGDNNNDGGNNHSDDGNNQGDWGDNHSDGDDNYHAPTQEKTREISKVCNDKTKTPKPTTQTPVVTKTTPVSTTQTPVVTKTTPVSTTQTPVVTKTTPVSTTQTPVVTKTTPVVTTVTPVTTITTTTTTTTTPPSVGDPDPEGTPFAAAFFIPETGGGRPIIVAGLGHSCMTYADGVVCWGLNSSGQLGDGSNQDQMKPVFVKDLHNVIDLTAGSYHTCALTADGEVWCWGENESGQVGNGTNINQSVPVLVKGLTGNVLDFTAGNDFTCAQLESGDIRCWGNNEFGQLNDGSLFTRYSAVKALFNDGQNMISGGQNNLVSDTQGDVGSWQNLQTDLVSNVNLPQFISANRFAPGGCVTTISGDVKCWQKDFASQQIVGATSSLLVGTGYQHACSINEDLTVSCWGNNLNGELGNGNTKNSKQAVSVSNLDSVADLAVGYNHTCVLEGDDYTAYCWGENTYGQLGNDSTMDSNTPVFVHLPE